MARNIDEWDDGGTPMWRMRHARPAVILDARRSGKGSAGLAGGKPRRGKRLTFGQSALLLVFAGFILPLAIVVAHAWVGWQLGPGTS